MKAPDVVGKTSYSSLFSGAIQSNCTKIRDINPIFKFIQIWSNRLGSIYSSSNFASNLWGCSDIKVVWEENEVYFCIILKQSTQSLIAVGYTDTGLQKAAKHSAAVKCFYEPNLHPSWIYDDPILETAMQICRNKSMSLK